MNELELTPENLCEAAVEGVIQFPALFYSNLAFVVVAIVIYLSLQRGKSSNSHLYLIAVNTFLIGIFSSIYHYSPTPGILFLDLFGIACLIASMLYVSFKKSAKLSNEWKIAISLGAVLTILTIVIFISNIIAFMLILLVYSMFLGSELQQILQSSGSSIRYRYLVSAVALQIVGTVFSMLERYDIFCNPNNHFIQGHAIWHVCTAISIYFIFLHFQNKMKDSTGA